MGLCAIALSTGLLMHLNWGWVVFASLLTGALYTTLGFLLVIRYRSIQEFLIPMIFAVVLLELPGLVYLGMPEYPILYALPTYAVLWLYRASIEVVSPYHLIYAVVYPLILVVFAFRFGARLLPKYVSEQLGTHEG
jgi:fluoroquinolone transport system permease protein